MHDTCNPWLGCRRVSEGCDHCFMITVAASRGVDGELIRRVSDTTFNYPLSRDRQRQFKVRPGEQLRVCMNSDFFLPQADRWRDEAWHIIAQRPDVKFWILTKRPWRIAKHLPENWGDGWDNVSLNVSIENQKRADQRLPYLLDVPAKHKGAMAAPLIGAIDIGSVLETGQLDEIIAGGENHEGNRLCDDEWVVSLRDQCLASNTKFTFIETGSQYRRNGIIHAAGPRWQQSAWAVRSGYSAPGRPIPWTLREPGTGRILRPHERHVPEFGKGCLTCGTQPVCNGLFQGRCQ